MLSELRRSSPMGSQITWYILSLIESILIIRFVMKLFQANPDAIFTNFIYSVSEVLIAPFAAVFQNMSIATSVFEWSILLAMLVYWLVAVAIVKLLEMGAPVPLVERDRTPIEEY